MKKKIAVFLFVLIAVAIYLIFYKTNKTLKFVPKDANVVILVDVKKLARQSIFHFVTNPSEWFTGSENKKVLTSIRNSGLKIPDYLQIIHVKNTKLLHFYTVVDIKDHQKLTAFLKENRFKVLESDRFQKENLYFIIVDDQCIITNSVSSLDNIENSIHQTSIFQANRFIDNSVASVSYISGQKIQNFGIDLSEDEIEIRNTSNISGFITLIKKLSIQNHAVDIELNKKNVKIFSQLFTKDLTDSAQISGVKIAAKFELVNDTIITYGFDDNFDETEIKTVQKILQPNFTATLKSRNTEKSWHYFRDKKWINDDFQFTALPLGPNVMSKNQNEIITRSLRKPLPVSKWQNQNYIFLSNKVTFPPNGSNKNSFENKLISSLNYIFYGNKDEDYYLKMKFKRGKLKSMFKL